MYAAHTELASLLTLAVSRDHLVGIAPLIVGLVVVAALIFAVSYGIRIRKRGDMRPSSPGEAGPDEHPGYETSHRVPDEVPHDGQRRMPYEFKDFDSDSHPGEHEQPRPKWDEGSSGSFGSGGAGHT
ncbi:MAG: DUF6479 family protein [Streptomyces sp.]